MRLIYSLIISLFCLSAINAQVDTTYMLVADITDATSLTDSTFSVEINAPTDQLGYFTPLGISVGMGLIDGNGHLYTVDSLIDLSFSDAAFRVVCVESSCIAPAQVGAVYRKRLDGRIPIPADGALGVSEVLQTRIHLHNILQQYGEAGLADSLQVLRDSLNVLRDSIDALRADIPAGYSGWTAAADSGTPAVISDGETVTIAGGTGLTTVISGNTITTNLDNTAVTPGTYGSATQTNQSTYDAQGRATNASNVTIAIAPSQVTGTAATTASNGLTKTGSDIAFGGTLTGATTITGASQDLTMTGLKYYNFEADSAIWRINGQKFIHMGSLKGVGYNYDELAIGYRAGANLPTYNSTANTLVGSYAGENLNGTGTGAGSGVSNALFGYNAGKLLTTGSYNSIFGVAAASGTSTTMSFSGGFGHHALISATGDYNFGFGNSTLATVSGGGNVAMGFQALESATSADVNTGIGHLALEEITTGDYNAGLGGGTLRNLTTGSQNTGVGALALNLAGTGSGNIGLGYNAGSTETGSNKLYIDNSNTSSPLIGGDLSGNFVGINQAVSSLAYVLDINSTGAMRFPRGTTAQRPATAAGIFRVNSDSTRFEWYTGSAWKSFSHVGDVTGGGSGTVTSVGLSLPSLFSVSGSPVTTSGTLTGTLATQAANTIFAGPTTGSAAAPAFRAMVEADLPAYTANRFLFSDGTTGKPTTSATATWDNTNGAAYFQGTGGSATPILQVRNAAANIAWINITDLSTGAGGTNGLLFGYNGAAYLYNRENTPMYLATNDITRLTIANGTGTGGFVSIGKGTSVANRLLEVQQATALTNTINYSARFGHMTSGTAAAGYGTGLEIAAESAGGTERVSATIEVPYTTATAAAEVSNLVFKTTGQPPGTLTTALTILGNGTLQPAVLSGTATQMVGATSTNILCPITLGTGLSFSSGILNGAFLPLTGGTLTGNLLFSADNTRNIGASGATRPANGYFGTKVFTPAIQISTGAANGYIFKCDASGNGSWVAPSSLGLGNGIISALPGGNVNIDTPNALIIEDASGGSESLTLSPFAITVDDPATNEERTVYGPGSITHNSDLTSPFAISSDSDVTIDASNIVLTSAGNITLNAPAGEAFVFGDLTTDDIYATNFIQVGGVSAGNIAFRENSINGANQISVRAPTSITADEIFDLRNTDGTAGQTVVTGISPVSATLDFGSTAAGTVSDLTVTVTGAAVGDIVTLGVPNASVPAAGTFFAWVSAANTVTVRFANNALVTAYDPASGSFKIRVTK